MAPPTDEELIATLISQLAANGIVSHRDATYSAKSHVIHALIRKCIHDVRLADTLRETRRQEINDDITRAAYLKAAKERRERSTS